MAYIAYDFKVNLFMAFTIKQHSLMDEIHDQLETMNRQFGLYMKHKTAMKNNLIGILNQTFPSANAFFDSPAREDGSQKWCQRKKHNFSKTKAEEIYETSKDLVSVLPKDDLTKLIIKQAVEQLNTASKRGSSALRETLFQVSEHLHFPSDQRSAVVFL